MMKITKQQFRKIIRESVRAGELMLVWNSLLPGDLIDVDTEYELFRAVRITKKVSDVSQHSGLEPGPGFVGKDRRGDHIVFNTEDIDPESYQKYIFAEGIQ
jgi:hypothetical protein